MPHGPGGLVGHPGGWKHRPEGWELEGKREVDAAEGVAHGELPPDMSQAEALSASEAELPAPDMTAAIRDRMIDLGEPGPADAPAQGTDSAGRGPA
jgi:hypothetical protein